jgi:hypothetical protein
MCSYGEGTYVQKIPGETSEGEFPISGWRAYVLGGVDQEKSRRMANSGYKGYGYRKIPPKIRFYNFEGVSRQSNRSRPADVRGISRKIRRQYQ